MAARPIFLLTLRRTQLHDDCVMNHIFRELDVALSSHKCRVPRPLRFGFSQLNIKASMGWAVDIAVNRVSLRRSLVGKVETGPSSQISNHSVV